jgi:BON domain
MPRRYALAFVLAAFALGFGCTKAPSDAALAEKIKAQMFSDQQLKNSNLNVTVTDGVATLSGEVTDDAAKQEAYKLTAQTPGVKKVDDQMSIEMPQATEVPSPPAAAPVPNAAPPATNQRERKSKRRDMMATYSSANPQSQETQPPPPPDSADQQSAPADATSGGAAEPANPAAVPSSNSPAPAPALATPEPAVPEPRDFVIATGTNIRVRMIDPVNSAVNHTGEIFHASLEAPIVVNNELVVPKGADVYVRLARASSAGSMSGRSELHLELVKLDYGGRSFALVSSTSSVVGSSRGKKTAAAVGAGAVIGGIIGAIAGGGRGAAIGAAAGGAGGGIYQASTKGQQVKVPAETVLDFQLEQPATVTVPYHPNVASD